jgi:hypothetical protein
LALSQLSQPENCALAEFDSSSGKLAVTGLEGIDLHRLGFVVDGFYLVHPRSWG